MVSPRGEPVVGRGNSHIMFAAGADALRERWLLAWAPNREREAETCLLSIDGALETGHRVRLPDCAQEDGLELVHARIGKEQGGVVVRHDRARGHWNRPR